MADKAGTQEVIESLEVQAARRMLADAEILGVGDHPVTERVRELLDSYEMCGPLNGGALAWWELNKDLPEVDWPVGCCIGNDMNSPEHCTCWVPVFDLEQQPPQVVDSWEQCKSQVGMCNDGDGCAYRPGSPERTGNEYDEEVLLDLARSKDQVFFCHAGMRRPVVWRHPDGREVPGSVKDYKPPYVGGIPYQADGRPGLVCGGWWALREGFKREVAKHPVWLQDLVDMHCAGEVLPGGMVWVDDLPVDGRRQGNNHRLRESFTPGDVEPIEGGGQGARLTIDHYDGRRPGEAPITPLPIRVAIVEVLRKHPGRWARVFDGGHNSACSMAVWYRKHLPGLTIDAEARRHGHTVAVYACFMAFGVL